MSKSFLQQLYEGNIYPAEKIVPKDPKYWKLCREIGGLSERFMESLPPEDKEVFEQIKRKEIQISSIYSLESFSYGFRLGAMLMADTFLMDDDIIQKNN